jgi:DNA-binding NarL/FixJ family response regulator
MHDHGGTGMATLARPAGAGRAAGASPRASLTRVVLADDSPLMHLAIRSMMNGTPGFVLEAAAGTVAMAEQLIQRVRPDLLILEAEIAGESGVGLCRWTRQASPASAVVLLTGRDEPLLIQSALSAGAAGYLLKNSPAEALLAGFRLAVGGSRVLDERLGRNRPRNCVVDSAAELGLTRREREILDEMLLGLDNKAIAARLCISEETVKSHVKAVFRKLGARDRAHAVALAAGSAPYTGAPAPNAWLPRPRTAVR